MDMKAFVTGVAPLLLAFVVSADYWGEWDAWSACSRTCDGGATYQLRRCMRSFRHGSRHGCQGESIRYATCNNQPCAPEPTSFREQQCAAYNDNRTGQKWRPYTDRKNPCALYCVLGGTRRLALLAPKVLDGTRCSHERLDMCINGTCWPVGCDNVLGSKKRFDMCGLCGGNNSCLNQTPKGKYKWVEAGLSGCSATCGVGKQIWVYQCREHRTGKLVKDHKCNKKNKPVRRTRECFRRKCPPSWRIYKWQECSHTCGGGHAFREIRCINTLPDGRQQWLFNSFCKSPRPEISKRCNEVICPTWYAGEWSPCSVTCGWGYQYRDVVCRHEGNTFCQDSNKPLTRKNCTTNFPCFDTDDGRNVAEHDENGGVQEVSLGELRQAKGKVRKPDTEFSVVHEDEVQNHDMSKPRFVVSSWGPCSATCGPGVRRRYVRCQVYLVYLQDIVDLADSECEEPKPTEDEPCVLELCFEDYEWKAVGLTPCSRSCLGGTQETMLDCVHKVSGEKVGPEYCERAPPIPIERRVCNEHHCPQRWRIGSFGSCSSTCGGGEMSREVKCIQEFAPGPDNVLNLPDFMCEQPVPDRIRECNIQDCPADWVIGNWTMCSTTCGAGITVRPVLCQRLSADGRSTDVKEHECRPSEKPESEKPCNERECPLVKIKEKRMKFFQLNKMPKVRLLVGTEAAILPGTSIIVRCPARGFSKKKIRWFFNGVSIKKGRRVNVSGRGNLRIKRSRPDKDTGVYMCKAGAVTANITVAFSNLLDIFQQTVVREKYLLGFLSDGSSNTNSALFKDPFDRQKRPLQIVISEWTLCPVSCGGGQQIRNISCEIITNDYFEEFPLRVCRDAGLVIPEKKRKCNEAPCVMWVSGNWSECSVDRCVRESYSIYKRTVHCIRQDNLSVMKEALCKPEQRPLAISECPNIHCKPMWNTSDWSHCSGACGKKGVQNRMLTCIWEFTGRPAGRSCETLRRPPVSQDCTTVPCSRSCVDTSDYCSIVKLMKLCRYANFKQRCCSSCRKRRLS